LTDAEYEKQYWLNIPESEVEDPNEVLFDPELLNPMRLFTKENK
jgi:hypothetical protein